MPTTPTQFRLGPDTLAELQAIADHLVSITGLPQTRTDAVRYAARQVARQLQPPAKSAEKKSRKKA